MLFGGDLSQVHKSSSMQLQPISGWYTLGMLLYDFALTELALWLAVQVRQVLPFGPVLSSEGWITSQIYVIAPLVVLITNLATGLYKSNRLYSARQEIPVALQSTLVSTVILAGLLYLMERQVSRWLFLYYGVLQATFMVTIRLLTRWQCRLWRVPLVAERRIVIVGVSEVGREVAQHLLTVQGAPYRVLGFIGVAPDPASTPEGLPLLGTIDRVESIVRHWQVDELLITLPLHAQTELAQLMQAIQRSPVQVSVIPDYFELAYLYARSDELADIPIIRLKEPVLTPWQRTLKRVFDVTLGTALLILLAPILVVSAVAIKLDSPGPVFYRQKRMGENGRAFSMFKLRTMVPDAEQQEKVLINVRDGALIFNKRPDDPRVTPVGKFLRRWSIDELPQIINVLRNDMSLVGPRPELPQMVERYSPVQHKRFAVPQGMTGWWQVNGRPQEVDQKVEYDLYYVRNYSAWLDAWILIKTIGAVLSRRGAC